MRWRGAREQAGSPVAGGGHEPNGDRPQAAVSARQVVKDYTRGALPVRALDGVDLSVERGEFVAVVGPSGSGKSTLLHLISALDRPSSGDVIIGGRSVDDCSDDDLSDLRRVHVGFVFQFFNLLPNLTAWENVALPASFEGASLRRLRPRALELLDRVDLTDRAEHRPAQLSGGQMQRVAIARALIASPSLLVADEPTGNLDSTTGEEVLDLLSGLVAEGTTLVMVTHSDTAAARASRVVHLHDGRIVQPETAATAEPAPEPR